MRSQAFFAALVAVMAMCVAPTIAAPTSRGVALAERGQLYARETTTVCGVSIRLTANCAGRKNPVHLGKRALLERSGSDSEHSSSHESQDSKGNSQGSSFKPGSSQGASSDAESEGAVECDHAVELQLLKFSAESNGFCDAMKELVILTGVTMETYLKDLKEMINQKTNLYPIPETWNQQKNAATKKFRAGAHAGTSQADLLPHDLDKKIIWGNLKLYVNSQPVTLMATSLTAKLDTEMHKVVTEAEAAAKKKQPAKAKEATDAAAKIQTRRPQHGNSLDSV